MSEFDNSFFLLGKQYTKLEPGKIGGVITLFESLKKELNDLGVTYKVGDLNWRNYKTPLHAVFQIMFSILGGFNGCKHVSLHGTANEFFYLAPIIVFFGKRVFGKRVSLRKFAGNFDELYGSAGVLRQWLARYAMKNADAVFFETKYLTKKFKSNNKSTFWFPNVRSRSEYQADFSFKHRFVFIGQVKRTKGIDEILKVFADLSDDYSIDIYGPLSPEYSLKDFLLPNISYKGVIAPHDASQVLSAYDVLVLPTFHPGEGYPGVILEAFNVGLPVISTNMRGIKEIVSEGVGVLIEGGCADQLLSAVYHFDNGNYEQYHTASVAAFSPFDARVQTKRFISLLTE